MEFIDLRSNPEYNKITKSYILVKASINRIYRNLVIQDTVFLCQDEKEKIYFTSKCSSGINFRLLSNKVSVDEAFNLIKKVYDSQNVNLLS